MDKNLEEILIDNYRTMAKQIPHLPENVNKKILKEIKSASIWVCKRDFLDHIQGISYELLMKWEYNYRIYKKTDKFLCVIDYAIQCAEPDNHWFITIKGPYSNNVEEIKRDVGIIENIFSKQRSRGLFDIFLGKPQLLPTVPYNAKFYSFGYEALDNQGYENFGPVDYRYVEGLEESFKL